MNVFELVVLALSLSMDSFSTAVCKGFELDRFNIVYTFTLSIIFSIFQASMPLIGFLFGNMISILIIRLGHFLSFFILVCLGLNMIKNSRDYEQSQKGISYKLLFLLALAISIDALSIGFTFVNLNINIILSTILIFSVTFITSFLGVFIGFFFGSNFNDKVLILGGLTLIALGIKILIL